MLFALSQIRQNVAARFPFSTRPNFLSTETAMWWAFHVRPATGCRWQGAQKGPWHLAMAQREEYPNLIVEFKHKSFEQEQEVRTVTPFRDARLAWQ
jgi:hypothetical protein